jgi:hypothetical protein
LYSEQHTYSPASSYHHHQQQQQHATDFAQELSEGVETSTENTQHQKDDVLSQHHQDPGAQHEGSKGITESALHTVAAPLDQGGSGSGSGSESESTGDLVFAVQPTDDYEAGGTNTITSIKVNIPHEAGTNAALFAAHSATFTDTSSVVEQEYSLENKSFGSEDELQYSTQVDNENGAHRFPSEVKSGTSQLLPNVFVDLSQQETGGNQRENMHMQGSAVSEPLGVEDDSCVNTERSEHVQR